MQEVTVDVTEQTDILLREINSEDPINLIERQALMAFRNGRPISKSVFLLSKAVAIAVEPQPVGPWLPREAEHREGRRGNDHASTKEVGKLLRSDGAT